MRRGVTERGDSRGDTGFGPVTAGGDHSPPYPHGVRVTPGDTLTGSLALGVSPRLPAHHGRVSTLETVDWERAGNPERPEFTRINQAIKSAYAELTAHRTERAQADHPVVGPERELLGLIGSDLGDGVDDLVVSQAECLLDDGERARPGALEESADGFGVLGHDQRYRRGESAQEKPTVQIPPSAVAPAGVNAPITHSPVSAGPSVGVAAETPKEAA